MLVAGGRLLVGTRPRDLPQQALERAVGLPDDLPFKSYVYYYLYLAALDGGHVARAGQYLAAYRLRLSQLAAAYHAVVWPESAFFAAACAQDLPAARAFRARAAPSARTEAALARVAGDAAQAQVQAERALHHLPDNPDQGGSCFYAEWLHQTLQWAAARGQAP